MPSPPALHLRHQDVWCFTWRNCMIFFWQRVTVPGLRATHEVNEAIRASYPQGLVTVSYMMPGAPLMPEPAARTESLRLMKETTGIVKASAAVLPGTGLAIAAARAFIAAITIAASRSDSRFKMFSDLTKVPAWIAPHMGHDPPTQLAAELGDALARVRAIRGA
jgi:hypothetical protein